jgi:hypothetical protein
MTPASTRVLINSQNFLLPASSDLLPKTGATSATAIPARVAATPSALEVSSSGPKAAEVI